MLELSRYKRLDLISFDSVFVVAPLVTPLLHMEGAYATRTEISRDILLSPKIHKDELSSARSLTLCLVS